MVVDAQERGCEVPPHCDSKDGPVVKAAIRALDAVEVDVVLPYVSAESEDEVRAAFEKTVAARACRGVAAEVADQWFFETVVRLHRAGEGAPFTGLKAAGLSHGDVVPVAERAIETGYVSELAELLTAALRREVARKFGEVMRLKSCEHGSLPEAREYVEAVLGFEVWSHKTHECITSDPLHDHGSMHSG